VAGRRRAAGQQHIEPPNGALTAESTAALDMLTVRAEQRRLADAVAAARGSALYGKLHTAFGKLSASQRGTWLALTATAVVAGSTAAVRQHAEAWLSVRSPKRTAQVALARMILGLLSDGGDGSLAELLAGSGLELATDGMKARALAVSVADVVDGLRRRDTGKDQS
jgi:hypothetical protein